MGNIKNKIPSLADILDLVGNTPLIKIGDIYAKLEAANPTGSVKDRMACYMAKTLAKKYGLLVGISSGANVLAAQKLKKKYKNVVTILPDRGERYLSKII